MACADVYNLFFFFFHPIEPLIFVLMITHTPVAAVLLVVIIHTCTKVYFHKHRVCTCTFFLLQTLALHAQV